MSAERQVLERWIKENPTYFAGLKQAIAGAEGTILGGRPGYNVMFGGGRFKDFSRHPDKVISSPGGYSSAAAGAYQFMPGTWQGVQQRLGLKDFGPQSPDLGMLQKVRERLMPLGGLSAITKAGTLTPEIQAALAPEWASFPTQSGKSYYGQPVKKAEQIKQFFEQGTKLAGTPPAPTPTPSAPVQKGNQLGNSFLRTLMNIAPFVQQRKSSIFGDSLINLQTPDLLTGQTFASTYLEDIARQMMEEV